MAISMKKTFLRWEGQVALKKFKTERAWKKGRRLAISGLLREYATQDKVPRRVFIEKKVLLLNKEQSRD